MAKRDAFIEPGEELDEKKGAKGDKKKKAQGKKGGAKKGDDGEEKETIGGKIVLFFVTLMIIAIWIGILAVLVKSDVGGFGSSVLYPMLKDVPYVNKILPEPEMNYGDKEETPYRSLDEALVRIQELERSLDTALAQNANDIKTIAELQVTIDDLSVYKEGQAAFEREKEKFYEEVVFSDVAPDIEEYRAYYESIDPENAAVLYKQVVEQIKSDETVLDYVKTYSQMQPKDAAVIFDQMKNNLGLVADILQNMGAKARGDILAKMDSETAAKLTEIMEPKHW